MSVELVSSTVVVLAQQFNASIFRDHWMTEQGVIGSPQDIQPGFIFSDVLVQFTSPQFQLLVTPEQCQFVPMVEKDVQQALIVERVGRIVCALPHTPYAAIGLNFHYHIAPEHISVEGLSKRLFFVDESPLHREFDCKDAMFGGYLSRNSTGFRLKLDVKPITLKNDGQEQHRLQLGFNFHFDLCGGMDERVQAIDKALMKWDEVGIEALRITNAVVTKDVK